MSQTEQNVQKCKNRKWIQKRKETQAELTSHRYYEVKNDSPSFLLHCYFLEHCYYFFVNAENLLVDLVYNRPAKAGTH